MGLVVSIGLGACASKHDINRDVAQASVDPHYLSTSDKTFVRLDSSSCGETDGSGTVTLAKEGDRWALSIFNARCGTLILDGNEIPMQGSGNQNRFGKVYFSGPGQYRVILGSRKFADSNGRAGTGDIFNVTIAPEALCAQELTISWWSNGAGWAFGKIHGP